MSAPVYPNIRLRLIGTDSHPLAIVAALEKSLKNGGLDGVETNRIMLEALSGDYDTVLATVMKYVRVY